MKSIAVIGLGQFGSQLAVGLSQKGFEVVGIDSEVESVNDIKDMVSQAIILDSTEEQAMRAVSIDNVDIAVVAIGSNVQSSLLTAALLQKFNIKDIYVRAIEPLQESILQSMGVKNIINIEKEMGKQLSYTISSGKVGRYIEISNQHSLIEIKTPVRFIGKTLKELKLRSRFSINIVGIKTRVPVVKDDGNIEFQEEMTEVPDPNYPLNKDDILVMSGTDENIQGFLSAGDPLDE